jgi:hypothetical protein
MVSWVGLYDLVSNLFLCLRSLSEAILETSRHGLHETHPSSSSRSTAVSLLCPIVRSHLWVWVSARRAGLLLDVVRNLSTPTARGVGLVAALSK